MTQLRDFMSDDHRHCDDLFAVTEHAVSGLRWTEAQAAFASFVEAMEAHFSAEEDVLFPAFENATGMTMGPTRVMRMEHLQLRDLFAAAHEAIAREDADAYFGEAETLLIMMQQHNMKEENILYPMCDEHLPGARDELRTQLRGRIAASSC